MWSRLCKFVSQMSFSSTRGKMREKSTHEQLSPPPSDCVIAAAPASQKTQVMNMLCGDAQLVLCEKCRMHGGNSQNAVASHAGENGA